MKPKLIYIYPKFRPWDESFRIGGRIHPVRTMWGIDSAGFFEAFTSKREYLKYHKDTEPFVVEVGPKP